MGSMVRFGKVWQIEIGSRVGCGKKKTRGKRRQGIFLREHIQVDGYEPGKKIKLPLALLLDP